MLLSKERSLDKFLLGILVERNMVDCLISYEHPLQMDYSYKNYEGYYNNKLSLWYDCLNNYSNGWKIKFVGYWKIIDKEKMIVKRVYETRKEEDYYDHRTRNT